MINMNGINLNVTGTWRISVFNVQSKSQNIYKILEFFPKFGKLAFSDEISLVFRQRVASGDWTPRGPDTGGQERPPHRHV